MKFWFCQYNYLLTRNNFCFSPKCNIKNKQARLPITHFIFLSFSHAPHKTSNSGYPKFKMHRILHAFLKPTLNSTDLITLLRANITRLALRRLECLNSSRADRDAVCDWSWLCDANSFMLNFWMSIVTVTPMCNVAFKTAKRYNSIEGQHLKQSLIFNINKTIKYALYIPSIKQRSCTSTIKSFDSEFILYNVADVEAWGV